MAKASGERNPVTYALRESRKGNLLADYFSAIGKEEQSMIFGEWDEEEYRRVMKREAFEDGEIAGAEANARANARNFLRMNLGTPEQIAQGTELPLEEVLALKEALAQETVAQ